MLIFAVAATATALGGTVPFGTPFRILLGLSWRRWCSGPVAAAAALRVARD